MKQSKSLSLGNLSILFTTILVIIFLGFYQTYLVFFPKFKGFHYEQHFHGLMMLLWMVLLIVQPLLIKNKKYEIHRFIGKLTYIIAPLLILSIFLVSKMVYHRSIATLSQEESLASVVLGLPNMFAFILFYYLAIFNSRNRPAHMRYMIGTALLMIGPGLGRLLITGLKWPLEMAVPTTNYLTLALSLAFLVNDIRKKSDFRPYLVIFLTLVMVQLFWQFRFSEFWQVPAKAFADLFF
jgi:hypothetical protein